jgi:hypothetical protein
VIFLIILVSPSSIPQEASSVPPILPPPTSATPTNSDRFIMAPPTATYSSSSSRPGSSKPGTPGQGLNGGSSGHSSLILRKQLLGMSMILTVFGAAWGQQQKGIREGRE